jgi:hypothetical protein
MCSPIYFSKANAGEAGQYERYLTKGILFLDQKEYPRATEELEAAIKDKPVHIHVPIPKAQETPVIIQIPIPDGT